jgi:hypothetical protein
MLATRTTVLIATGLLTLAVHTAQGQSTTTGTADSTTNPSGAPAVFDRVEEDWELVVASPDPVAVGPQVTTCMSPVRGNPSPFFVAFNLNYRELPDFLPGGMQVQVWAGSQSINASSQGQGLFNTSGEKVTWTQQMWLSQGLVNYAVANGQSSTWGNFGLAAVFPASVNSLAGYDPDGSAATSGVGWESNFVDHLTLVRVRYYSGSQLLWTDTNPRSVVDNRSSTPDPQAND